jgi:diguanylate cyclase (GGDEF)-like protein/PAS domain S-box-containing protein
MEGDHAIKPANTVVAFSVQNKAGINAVATQLPADYAVLIIDLSGQIRFASPSAAQLFNLADATLPGQPITNLLPSLPFSSNDIEANLAFLDVWSNTADWQRIRANTLILEARLNRTEIAGQLLVIVQLRTAERQQAHIHLQNFIQPLIESEELLVVTDTSGKIVYVNPAFEKLSGFTLAEAMGRTLEEMLAWEKYPPLYARMWTELYAGKSFHGIFINRNKNQRLFHEERNARPFVNLEGRVTHYIFTGRDVSDREKLLQRLEHTANHDELTDLPNRHLFLDRFHRAQAHAARWTNGFALLLLDLDQFKSINDRFGHAAGDAALITVANRLSTCLRQEDTLARLGGDEFAILLTDLATLGDVIQVLDKIVSLLRKPFQFNGTKLSIQASIGVAFYPLDTLHTDILFNHADSAMYRAKVAGGNGYHIHHPHADHADDDATSGQYILLGQQDWARFGTTNTQNSSTTTEETPA